MTPLRIPVAIVSLAVFSLFLSGCKASDVTPESGEQKVSVRVSEVTGGERQDMPLRCSGIVRAPQRATLTFQVSGTLRDLSLIPIDRYRRNEKSRVWRDS